MNTRTGSLSAAAVALLSFVLARGAQAHEGHEHAPHGNHDAHHGGFVMMYQDLHFEIVLPKEGGVRLYYTDAVRAELPAAVVSDVAVEIERAGAKPEAVPMAISASGDYWEGQAKPLPDARAVIRIAFLFQGKPAMFNISAANLPAPGRKPAGKTAQTMSLAP